MRTPVAAGLIIIIKPITLADFALVVVFLDMEMEMKVEERQGLLRC